GRAAQDVPHRRPHHAVVRLCGAVHGKVHRGVHEVHHHGHVRQGRPGDEGGGRREVGGRRAAEDLRSLTPHFSGVRLSGYRKNLTKTQLTEWTDAIEEWH